MSVLALNLIMTIDAIAYMVITPSLVFYVLDCGGTYEQYGFALSIFSFASFLGKPILGAWVDASGNKFRVPYFVSISFAAFGGILYYLADSFKDTPSTAVAMIIAGRFLGGLGAANQALCYAYLASTVPPSKQTQTSTSLSMTRIIGMAVGPGFNVFLAKVAGSIDIFGRTFEFNPSNSVGLFLTLGNVLGLVAIAAFLQEPPQKVQQFGAGAQSQTSAFDWWSKIKALCCLEIVLPMITVFTVNSNFQL